VCGLISILAKNKSGFFNKDSEIFQQLLYIDALRGWDATGVFGVTKLGNIDIKKQAAAAGHFCMTKQFDDFKKKIISEYQMIVGHNRKATHGEKKHIDAHPFWDKEEKICLVHNGMISNHKDFCKDSTIDSAAIANALAKDSVEGVIENIIGAFAFIWYNIEEKTLFFIRNEQRPLYIIETNATYLLGSEVQMLQWICERNQETIKHASLVKENTLFSFSLEKRELVEVTEIKAKKKETYITYLGYPRMTNVKTEIFNITPDSLYLTTFELNSVEKIMKNINRQDELNVECMSYDVVGPNSIKVDCKLINVDVPNLRIIMWMTKSLFDMMDLTKVQKVSVLSLTRAANDVTIYVNSPEEVDHLVTQNDITITTGMWCDDKFPLICDCCASNIKWVDIKNSQVLLMDKDVISVVCPKCTTKKD
jgi:hypothetical protein